MSAKRKTPNTMAGHFQAMLEIARKEHKLFLVDHDEADGPEVELPDDIKIMLDYETARMMSYFLAVGSKDKTAKYNASEIDEMQSLMYHISSDIGKLRDGRT